MNTAQLTTNSQASSHPTFSSDALTNQFSLWALIVEMFAAFWIATKKAANTALCVVCGVASVIIEVVGLESRTLERGYEYFADKANADDASPVAGKTEVAAFDVTWSATGSRETLRFNDWMDAREERGRLLNDADASSVGTIRWEWV